MELLKFSDAISNCNPSLPFPRVAAFDEYFSFSGKRYRVIEACTVNKVSGYRVESYEVKQNIPLTILKVMSMITLIIPIIMGIGKLIARNHYQFFIEAKSKAENEITTTIQNKIEVKNSKQPELEKRRETSEIFSMQRNSPENLKNPEIPPVLSAIPDEKIGQNKIDVKNSEQPQIEKRTANSEIFSMQKISTEALKKPEIIKPIVLPAIPGEIQDRVDTIQRFKKKALDLFHQSKSEQKQLDFTLNEAQKENLVEINKNKFSKSFSGGKIVRGGSNYVFFLDSIPGFVFKPMKNKAHAERYIGTVQKARQLVTENNLYLLHVPEAKLIEVNGIWFVMQEKANLLFSSHREQKGVYTSCWDDEEMQEFMKTVFSQLLFFISRTQFGDVKYNNIPFTCEGNVALIDLDEGWCITGLACGGYGKNDGLFNYIPPKYLSHFFQCAKNQLDEQDYRELEPEFVKIKERAEKKLKKDKDYSDFCTKNSILCPSQNITSDLSHIFTEIEKRTFAKFMIEHINQKLSSTKNFSIKFGRTISLETKLRNPLGIKAKEIWGSNLQHTSANSQDPSLKTFLTEVLEDLKNAGYIFKYKVSRNYSSVKVVC